MTVNLDEEFRKMAKTEYEKEQGIKEEPTFFGEDIPRKQNENIPTFFGEQLPKGYALDKGSTEQAFFNYPPVQTQDDDTGTSTRLDTIKDKTKAVAKSLDTSTKKQIAQGIFSLFIPKNWKAGWAKAGVKERDWLKKLDLLKKQHGWNKELQNLKLIAKAKAEEKKTYDRTITELLTGNKEGIIGGKQVMVPKTKNASEFYAWLDSTFSPETDIMEMISKDDNLKGNWLSVLGVKNIALSNENTKIPGASKTWKDINLYYPESNKVIPRLIEKHPWLENAFTDIQKDTDNKIKHIDDENKYGLTVDLQDTSNPTNEMVIDKNQTEETDTGTIYKGQIKQKDESQIKEEKDTSDIISRNNITFHPAYYGYLRNKNELNSAGNVKHNQIEEGLLFNSTFKYTQAGFQNRPQIAKEVINKYRSLNAQGVTYTDTDGTEKSTTGQRFTLLDVVAMSVNPYPETIRVGTDVPGGKSWTDIPNEEIQFLDKATLADAEKNKLRIATSIDVLDKIKAMTQPIAFRMIGPNGVEESYMMEPDAGYILKFRNWAEGLQYTVKGFSDMISMGHSEISNAEARLNGIIHSDTASPKAKQDAKTVLKLVNKAKVNVGISAQQLEDAGLSGTMLPGVVTGSTGQQEFETWLKMNFQWDGEWTHEAQPVIGKDGKPTGQFRRMTVPVLGEEQSKKYRIYRNAATSAMQAMFAYKLSASIQGYSAGGRTISNFDYEIADVAMNFGGLRSLDQIRAAVGIVSDFMYKDYYRNQMMVHPLIGKKGKFDIADRIFFGNGGLYDQSKAQGMFSTIYSDVAEIEPLTSGYWETAPTEDPSTFQSMPTISKAQAEKEKLDYDAELEELLNKIEIERIQEKKEPGIKKIEDKVGDIKDETIKWAAEQKDKLINKGTGKPEDKKETE